MPLHILVRDEGGTLQPAPSWTLDDGFISAAPVTEPSAADLAYAVTIPPPAHGHRPIDVPPPAGLGFHRPAPPRRPLPARLGILLVGVIIAVRVLATLGGAPGTISADLAPVGSLPERIELVLALPMGVTASPSLLAGVQHEADLAQDWLEAQAGGALDGRLDRATVVMIQVPDGVLPDPFTAVEVIEAAVDDARGPDPQVLEVVVTTLGTGDGPDDPCGLGSPLGVVVLLGNCGLTPSAGTTAFGRGVSRVIAHELVHAMGGVAPCAPNHVDGHVRDDPADLMTAEFVAGSGTAVLDAAGDDYLSRGAPVCADIMASPLWRS